MLLALAFSSPALAGDLVQTDVALVRAAPRDDATVLTRLPINTEVEVVDRTPSAQGYVAVRVSNDAGRALTAPRNAKRQGRQRRAYTLWLVA